MKRPHEHWTGRIGFGLATMATAVGLGAIWKFPYEVGANGGGIFLLLYLVALATIVAPLMLAELAIGRRGRFDAVKSMARVAEAAGASRIWSVVGGIGVVTCGLILSYYSVVSGWTIAYAFDPRAGLARDLVQSRHYFEVLLAHPVRMAVLHGLFMLIIASIVARGVSAGIERATRILMPGMIGLIVALALYALLSVDARPALKFLFVPNFTTFSARAAIEAVGLAFFSIGVGFGTYMTYAAYTDARMDFVEVAIVTLVADTAVSLLAAIAIFPLVFSRGVDPAGGPGLAFVILPMAFANLPQGPVVARAFYLCLALAATASAISLLEMPVAYLRRAFGWPRVRATIVAAALIWLAGLITVMAFGPWSAWRPLAGVPGLAGAGLFELVDGFASKVMLPLAGFGLSFFAGWVLPASILAEELGLGRRSALVLSVVLRFLVPMCIVLAAFGALIPKS